MLAGRHFSAHWYTWYLLERIISYNFQYMIIYHENDVFLCLCKLALCKLGRMCIIFYLHNIFVKTHILSHYSLQSVNFVQRYYSFSIFWLFTFFLTVTMETWWFEHFRNEISKIVHPGDDQQTPQNTMVYILAWQQTRL